MATKDINADISISDTKEDPQIGNAKTIQPDNEGKTESAIQQPKIIQTAKHLTIESNIKLTSGQVYVVGIDENGQEKPGSGFITTAHTFNKSYSKTKFKIKKKA